MDGRLLERSAELEVLVRAVDDAGEGHSSVVLLLGEAGIGKTSLVRAFRDSVADRARVLVGSCDDLLTPRTFGPLRDAADEHAGPLADALADDSDQEAVYQALRRELQPRDQPTVLVVEDLHWADDATLDALRYVCRRLQTLTALVVLTFRDDDIDDAHPLRRLLGALATQPVQRLQLHPLSRGAVVDLAAETGVDVDGVFTITRGNPFFVTEVLASPEARVPVTVVDAVMARVRQLPQPTRAALEQLAVVPSRVQPAMVRALVGDVEVLEVAEQRRVLEVRADGVAFRHELARLALLRSIPRTRQAGLHQNVLDVLLSHDRPDLSRVVHHAVAAGDVDTVLSKGQEAARQAARAGSHRQALAHYEQVAMHLSLLTPPEQARVLVDYSWELYVAQRWNDSVTAARRALKLWERMGDRVAEGGARVVLSRSYFMADRPADSIGEAQLAVTVLEPTGDVEALAHAETYLGAVQALTDRQDEALPRLLAAQVLAERAGRRDLVALCSNYIGCARVDLGDVETGLADLRRSLRLAMDLPHHEYAGRAYTNLAEVTYQLRRYSELESWIDSGVQFAADHDLPGHLYNLEAHRALLMLGRGQWDEAQTRLQRLVGAVAEPGQLTRLTLAPLGRLMARRGDEGAAEVLAEAWELALRNGSLAALAPAGLAIIESAWLAGDSRTGRSADHGPDGPYDGSRRGPDQGRAAAVPRAGRPDRRDVPRLPARVGSGAERRLAAGGRAVAAHRRPVRAGPRAGRFPDDGGLHGGAGRARRAGSGRRRPAGACRAARARRHPHPARSVAGDPGEPGRPDPAAGRRPGPARDRADQLRDRRPAGRLHPHGRPPRVGHPDQARRRHPAGRRAPRRRAGTGVRGRLHSFGLDRKSG